MNITSNSMTSVTTTTQTIDVADGPIIGAGDSYIDGTRFHIERVRIRKINGARPDTIKLIGPQVDERGDVVYYGTKRDTRKMHELNVRLAELPETVVDILNAADVAL